MKSKQNQLLEDVYQEFTKVFPFDNPYDTEEEYKREIFLQFKHLKYIDEYIELYDNDKDYAKLVDLLKELKTLILKKDKRKCTIMGKKYTVSEAKQMFNDLSGLNPNSFSEAQVITMTSYFLEQKHLNEVKNG